MTCVVGIKDKGGVWLGADSATATDTHMMHARDRKIFGIKAGTETIGIAIAGSWKFAAVARYHLELPEIPKRVDVSDWMHTTFGEVLSKALGVALNGHVESERWKWIHGGSILVAVRGRLFTVFAVDTVPHEVAEGYAAEGSGELLALGAFHATRDEVPYARMHRALRAAAAHARGVRPPFRVEWFAK